MIHFLLARVRITYYSGKQTVTRFRCLLAFHLQDSAMLLTMVFTVANPKPFATTGTLRSEERFE